MKIPKGKVKTYKEVAIGIKMPKYILIGLLVVIGTFVIMNYWPKLKDQTKNRILMLIFGAFFLSIFVLLILLMF